jgi:hypothetical protein
MHLKFLWEKNYSTPMLKQHHRFFNLVFQVFDLFLVILAWLASYPLRLVYLRPLFPVKKGIPLYDSYAYLSFAIVLLWYIVFVFSGVYKSRRTQSLWPEIITIVRAHTLAFVIMSSVAFLLTGELFSRGIFLVFYFVALGLLFIERLFLRQVLKSLRRRGFNQRNTLIVGDNEISAAFLERLGHHLELELVDHDRPFGHGFGEWKGQGQGRFGRLSSCAVRGANQDCLHNTVLLCASALKGVEAQLGYLHQLVLAGISF